MKITIRQKSGMNYLYADINVSGIRVKATLGISLGDATFNPRTELVKGSASDETNILIVKMKEHIMELIRQLQKDGLLCREEIKHGIVQIREHLTNPESKREVGLSEYAEMSIERCISTHKSGTIRQLKVSLGKLKLYEKSRRKRLKFSDINMHFYHDFVSFCTTEMELAVNSVGTHIKNIKFWMNQSMIDGLHDNTVHQNRAFKKLSEPADTIYLNEDEIKQIRYAIMPSESLDNVRDIFILACYTGVRINDYHKLDAFHMINNGTMLKIRTEKTDAEVVIPLHPEAKRILEKYNGKPRMISNQKFNDYIKIVCKYAGINDMISVTRTYGGKKKSVVAPKYDLVTSHCARRSFATNAYLAGVPTLAIMAITGHKTEKVFLKYVRVSKEEHAKLMLDHGFFKSKIDVN
ncbi:MAG: tyrosine-type recombinase/integrase [Crocinitomicaceae bacterium]